MTTRSDFRIVDGFVLGGSITKKDFKIHSHVYKTFLRYVRQIESLSKESAYHVGMTSDPQIETQTYNAEKVILINPLKLGDNKGQFLDCAIQAVIARYEGTNEVYTRRSITRHIFTGLFDKTFRI